MKKTSLSILLLSAFVIVVCVVIYRKSINFHATPFVSEQTEDVDVVMSNRDNQGVSEQMSLSLPYDISTKEERLKMNASERIALLEKLGYVPSPSDLSDYYFAEKTSWWGKRLDPKEFWQNRVVWLDSSASSEARRRGRAYPPIPYEDLYAADRCDIDKGGTGGYTSLDGGWLPGSKFSERENVFWNNFTQTHPRPPNDIRDWLKDNADRWLRTKNKLDNDPESVKRFKLKPSDLEHSLTRTLNAANSSWFPPECVSPEVYYWDHVMRKRSEYEEHIKTWGIENTLPERLFFNDVYVDRALITNSLTQEQVDAANAWKVAYLNRLRSENWDESYINAYLQAWNLTEEYVFGETKEQGR